MTAEPEFLDWDADGEVADVAGRSPRADFASPPTRRITRSRAIVDREERWEALTSAAIGDDRDLEADAGDRRTVVITDHVSDRVLAPRSRTAGAVERPSGLYADRTAMWAVLLGVMLLLVALTSH